MPEENRVRSMGQLIKFPEAHTEQIAMTPGLGRNTEANYVPGKSTNMLNACQRLLQNIKMTPEAEYFSDVSTLTSAGELIMCIMDKVGKSVRIKMFD